MAGVRDTLRLKMSENIMHNDDETKDEGVRER